MFAPHPNIAIHLISREESWLSSHVVSAVSQISGGAKSCLQCGVKNPGGWFSYTGTGCGGCGVFLLIVIGVLILFGMCFAV